MAGNVPRHYVDVLARDKQSNRLELPRYSSATSIQLLDVLGGQSPQSTLDLKSISISNVLFLDDQIIKSNLLLRSRISPFSKITHSSLLLFSSLPLFLFLFLFLFPKLILAFLLSCSSGSCKIFCRKLAEFFDQAELRVIYYK